MDNQPLENLPDDFVLLKSTSNSIEAITVTGLLEAHSIATRTVSEGESTVIGRLDGALPLYKIFVRRQELDEARKLIAPNNDNSDYEWKKHREREDTKGKSWSRAVGLLIASVFFVLSLSPMKESSQMMNYVFFGVALCLILIVLFSFKK